MPPLEFSGCCYANSIMTYRFRKMASEGFQRAIGKPFGRIRRCEIYFLEKHYAK